MKYNKSITFERVAKACQFGELDCPGFCLSCGEDIEGVEPDARYYRCEFCGEEMVFGAEECLLMGIGT
ncbi:MAG TPA: hypothetical protein VIY48_00585 [Candidatus Paceibacterota bacterium]